MEAFGKTRVMTNPKHWHHFGCPAYVLDGALQGGAGIFHEWKERSKMGIHLGLSSQHARLVTLVLNLTTGLVSPQFHINFYPLFHRTSEEEHPPPSLWQIEAGFVSQSEGVKQRADSVKTVSSSKLLVWTFLTVRKSRLLQKETAHSQFPQQRATHRLRAQPLLQRGTSTESQTTKFPLPAAKARALAPPAEGGCLHKGLLKPTWLPWQLHCPRARWKAKYFTLAAMFPNLQERHPMQELHACAASANPNTMYLHKAMQQPDREQFLQAMNQEVNGQLENKNFSIFPWSSVPEGAPVLP